MGNILENGSRVRSEVLVRDWSFKEDRDFKEGGGEVGGEGPVSIIKMIGSI
jgi:hypothetical protein